jgi:septum formation protein
MPENLPPLILASRSPRRRELLREAGYRFEVFPPSESAEKGDCREGNSAVLVARLACRKAADVAKRIHQLIPERPEGKKEHERLILGCDTVVECRGRIIGKPRDQEHARQILCALRGREHRVLSGLCLWKVPADESLAGIAVTRLRMDALSDAMIEEYLAGGQWEGKAGAFGYQDRLDWVHVIEGSQSNVVGLPLELLAEMLLHFSLRQVAGG